MLLVALDLVTPEMTLESLGGVKVTQFLTPAMVTFAALNAGFVSTVIGTALAREQGILKRLRGTPLPAWVYFAGRFGASVALALCSAGAVLATGIFALHAHLARGALWDLLASFALGLAVAFLFGAALGAFVRKAEAALPLAYAVLLPVAFISGLFFPAPGEAHWLASLARGLPVAPFAGAMEANFLRAPTIPRGHELVVLAIWGGASALLAAKTLSREPGEGLLGERRARRRDHRHGVLEAAQRDPR
jgi:ABC-type multidrug transport system permease subunit